MSGPGADKGEQRARALLISSAESGGQSLNGSRRVCTSLGGSPGKKWLRSAWFSSCGVEAPGSSGNQGGGAADGEFFGRAHSLRGSRGQEGGPVGSLRLFDGFEVCGPAGPGGG